MDERRVVPDFFRFCVISEAVAAANYIIIKKLAKLSTISSMMNGNNNARVNRTKNSMLG
jgi:hypothetical protein